MSHIQLKHQLRNNTLEEKSKYPFDKFIFFKTDGSYKNSRIRFNTSLYLKASDVSDVLNWLLDNHAKITEQKQPKYFTHHLECAVGIPCAFVKKLFGTRKIARQFSLTGVGVAINLSDKHADKWGNIEIEFQDRTRNLYPNATYPVYERFCINLHICRDNRDRIFDVNHHLPAFFSNVHTNLITHSELRNVQKLNISNYQQLGYRDASNYGKYANTQTTHTPAFFKPAPKPIAAIPDNNYTSLPLHKH